MHSGVTKKSLIALALVLCFLCPGASIGETGNSEAIRVLETTESLFKAMKEKNYPKVWSLLTRKSHQIIINDVRKAVAKGGAGPAAESLEADFASGGRFSREYWEAYLKVFDPEIVLEQCKWEMGRVGENESEIILQYRKSEQPAVLKIYREDSTWKVGLEETFRPRRWHMP